MWGVARSFPRLCVYGRCVSTGAACLRALCVYGRRWWLRVALCVRVMLCVRVFMSHGRLTCRVKGCVTEAVDGELSGAAERYRVLKGVFLTETPSTVRSLAPPTGLLRGDLLCRRVVRVPHVDAHALWLVPRLVLC